MKKILLISNELSMTGAPLELFYMAQIMQKNGCLVDVWSFADGALRGEFSKIGINVEIIPLEDLKKQKKKFCDYGLVISNTIVSHKAYRISRKYTPSIFFITEAEQWTPYCRNKNLGALLRTSKDIYCVSEYAAGWLEREFKNSNVKVFHNAVEDLFDGQRDYFDGGKINFLVFGTISPQKGMHTAIDAVNNLPEEYKKKIRLRIAGKVLEANKQYYSAILKEAEKSSCIEFLGEITNINDKISLYKKTDVVIVPSVDESCSLVALEAAMMKCALVLTKNVGAKYILKNERCFFEWENSEQLKNILIDIIDSKINVAENGNNLREEFLKTSTLEIYEKNVMKMVNEKYGKQTFSPKFQYLNAIIVETPYTLLKFVEKIFSVKQNYNHRVITV